MLKFRIFGPAIAAMAGVCGAAAAAGDAPAPSDFRSRWFETSNAAKESQPHWMTPLVTVTPRLEQEFRYDQSWQDRANGGTFDNFGGGKGLELIPAPNTELIIGVPAYQEKWTRTARAVGTADESLLLKYRLLSRNEEHGNYVVTAFLAASLPTGSENFTSGRGVLTPTLAAGKGWGTRARGFDLQSTASVSVPLENQAHIGEVFTWNAALQAHPLRVLWPELEGSYSVYRFGPNAGKHQFAWTAGTVFGRFDLGSGAKGIIGCGYQWTVGGFRSYLHQWLFTGRVAF